MTSKLIVNSLAADTGVSTITFADQAKMGNAIFHSTGFTIGDSFLHSTGVNITNINATGVITATKFVGEVSVGSSITFEDNEKAYFGTGTDFSIYHNGSASYLDETGTGGLIVKTDTAFQVFNSAGSQPAFTVTPGGAVELYHNTTKVLETKGYGIDIAGGFIQTGSSIINDNGKLQLGTGADLQLYHNGTNSIIKNNTGELEIRGSVVKILGATGAEASVFTRTGSVELTHNGTKKFETTSAGADFTLSSGGQVNLYHLGSDGGLRISGPQSASSATLFFNTNHQNVSGGTDYYTITCGGANHTLMFKRGDMSGTTVLELDDTQHVRIPQDNKALKIGASQDLQISHDGSTNIINGLYHPIELRHQSEVHVKCVDDGAVELYHNNLKQCETSANGLAFPSGKGIDFSATGGPTNSSGSASGTSELLDDYEIGTFSPFYTDNQNTQFSQHSSGYSYGEYVKIGKLVYFTCGVRCSGYSRTPSGRVFLEGLPFVSKNYGDDDEPIFAMQSRLWGSGTPPTLARMQQGTGGTGRTRISLGRLQHTTSNENYLEGSHFDTSATCRVVISGHYMVP